MRWAYVWWVYTCCAAGLAAVYFIFPGHHLAFWSPLGFSAAVAVFVGLWRHQPVQRLAWALLGCALLAFITGDTLYNIFVDVMGEKEPVFPPLPTSSTWPPIRCSRPAFCYWSAVGEPAGIAMACSTP